MAPMQGNRRSSLVDCPTAKRHRCAETTPSAFVESTVDQVISKRMVNKQQMRWSLAGAQLFLQVRTQVLSNDLTARTSGAGTRASPTRGPVEPAA
jgi:hypothetical protein